MPHYCRIGRPRSKTVDWGNLKSDITAGEVLELKKLSNRCREFLTASYGKHSNRTCYRRSWAEELCGNCDCLFGGIDEIKIAFITAAGRIKRNIQ